MSRRQFTRRGFLAGSGASLLLARSYAQAPIGARASMAEMERAHILARADTALSAPIVTLDSLPTPQHTPSNQFFSEARDTGASARPFRGHAEALRHFSETTCALIAASVLTHEDKYAARAAAHLRQWIVRPETRMEPQPDLAGCSPGTTTPTRDNTLDLVPLAETARAWTFLYGSAALDQDDQNAIGAWFTDLLTWLNANDQAKLARETKDKRASAWLLLAGAAARATRNENQLDRCRLWFKKPTLRNQVAIDGRFPQEIASPAPYRNTLFNFDLLAGACQLLTSPFDDLWNYELPEGPGMRSVAAFLYPYLRERTHWPFIADSQFFRDLPGRRPGLLFAGRAYDRPEYVQAYAAAPDTPPPEAIAYSFPITQPLLWTMRAPHGL